MPFVVVYDVCGTCLVYLVIFAYDCLLCTVGLRMVVAILFVVFLDVLFAMFCLVYGCLIVLLG